MSSVGVPWIGVAIKAVSLRADRAGPAGARQGALGWSAADAAALEWGLRLAAASGAEVVAAVAGPPGVEAVLRDAMAVGAARAVRIDVGEQAPSGVVAAGLGALARSAPRPAQWWLCGVRSVDRGGAMVPALLAAELEWVAAAGLSAVERRFDGAVLAERRLERGRRERLCVHGPAVLSVEAGAAVLRRAALPDVLAASRRPVTVLAPPDPAEVPTAGRITVVEHRPFRPRPSVLAAPRGDTARERVAALTGVFDTAARAPRLVQADPATAAQAILDALRTWGYLEPPVVP